MSDKQESKPIGKCCENTPMYSAMINNSPLDSFCILLCSVHIFDPTFTKNAINIKKLETENKYLTVASYLNKHSKIKFDFYQMEKLLDIKNFEK